MGPGLAGPSEQVQIDHTPVDVIVVDDHAPAADRLAVRHRAHRRGQRLPGRHGRDVGDAVGNLGRVVPGAHGHPQAGLAGTAQCAGGVADDWQATAADRDQTDCGHSWTGRRAVGRLRRRWAENPTSDTLINMHATEYGEPVSSLSSSATPDCHKTTVTRQWCAPRPNTSRGTRATGNGQLLS